MIASDVLHLALEQCVLDHRGGEQEPQTQGEDEQGKDEQTSDHGRDLQDGFASVIGLTALGLNRCYLARKAYLDRVQVRQPVSAGVEAGATAAYRFRRG